MRKLMIFLLLFAILCPGAAAAEPTQYLALTIEGFPAGNMGQVLLEELTERNAHATFFLDSGTLENNPELGEALISRGHEIGLPAPEGRDLSRRAIAGEISAFRSLVPRGGRVRFLRLPEERCSDGMRQVAEAMKLSFLDWSRDFGGSAWRARIDKIRDGDVLRFTITGSADLPAMLDLLDWLQSRGFTLVSASELALRRQVTLRPGRRYREFSGEGR